MVNVQALWLPALPLAVTHVNEVPRAGCSAGQRWSLWHSASGEDLWVLHVGQVRFHTCVLAGSRRDSRRIHSVTLSSELIIAASPECLANRPDSGVLSAESLPALARNLRRFNDWRLLIGSRHSYCLEIEIDCHTETKQSCQKQPIKEI
jgi:hypothetical protein